MVSDDLYILGPPHLQPSLKAWHCRLQLGNEWPGPKLLQTLSCHEHHHMGQRGRGHHRPFQVPPDLNLFIFNKTCSDGESRSLGLLSASSHQLQPVLKPRSAICFRLLTAHRHPGTKPGAARVDIKSQEDRGGNSYASLQNRRCSNSCRVGWG